MAAEIDLFNKKELNYVATSLSSEAANPKGVLSDENVIPEVLWSWAGFEALTAASQHYMTLQAPKGRGKKVTAQMWEEAKITLTVSGMLPVYIFVIVPNSITDPRLALRCFLCTLISGISGYVTKVPPEKMAEEGVLGGQFVRKYIDAESDDDNDGISPLVQLLNALRHCNFATTYRENKNSDAVHLEYVIVVEGFMRLVEDAGWEYYRPIKAAIDNTLSAKMEAYTLFVEEN
ncbi:hypothetical protein EKO27_g8415 [Xylaria grammica]|uniref:Uncharacterized protein n=1 Tax=Xylaria grammica TaxID=363999 RepID=A0A439CX32_9PEZI|nr:hypothetical protein EKO27_g8415 [Xylaria grammica]